MEVHLFGINVRHLLANSTTVCVLNMWNYGICGLEAGLCTKKEDYHFILGKIYKVHFPHLQREDRVYMTPMWVNI